ncbi:hypothetical protein INT43_000971 [Umbelopsis isabellina]|uniref:glycogenin glucosyltransferase n=1 Tax=Mortierella isabellina TaxID=91625 RepID=A0A8H7Q360_MORIS|nr:hypothetical protein INT43_000971 [Umbelopsis isabellina]
MTRAYVTLVVTDRAAAGALVLAHRLRDLHDGRDSGQKLVCLVTSDVSANTEHALATVYEVVRVNIPRGKAALNLHLLGKPETALSLAKIELWKLTQYEKVLYLDPDVLPLRPIDELFEFEEMSAAPDIGWPDWFHTGVFVANPNQTTYAALKTMTEQDKVYEAGDQGLLNEHFEDWSTSGPSHRIPFAFNIVASAIYSYAPASKEFRKDVKMVRFSDDEKPWDWVTFQDGRVFPRGTSTSSSVDFAQLWWDTWDRHNLQQTAIAEFLPQRDPLQAPELSNIGALKNAWDTSAIIEIADHSDERTFVHPLPPLPPITFQDEVWRGEEQHNQEQQSYIYAHGHHQPAEHNEHQEHHGEQEQHENYEQQHVHAKAPEHDIANVNTRHHEDIQEQEYHHHVPEENYDMLNWNPSWEEPPQNQSAVDIPNLQIYGNAWDNPQSHHQVWIPPQDLPPPPPSVDYHHQYNHTPANSQKEEQVPDWQHDPVFPWEEKRELRHMPTRIWQDEQELEKRVREEEEYRRIEAERAAAEAENSAIASQHQEHSHYQDQHNHHAGDLSGKQEVIQQALEVENDIIEQTISETAGHPQEQPSTLDQPFVSVWDQMPDIQKYLARIGVHDAFKHSEYQPLTVDETEEVVETLEQQEFVDEEEEAEEFEGSAEEYEELKEEYEVDEVDEEKIEDHTKITKPVHLDIDPPPTLAQSWWGEPFAIDSMPTTPLIGKSGARSPMLPMTPRLEDDDWDDRDLIPLPLKRTSKLFQGDLPVFPESKTPVESKSPLEAPNSDPNVSPDDNSLKQKKKRRIKKLRKLFADENDMIRKTPFASAATTPTSEKGFILPPVEVEETVVETVNLPRPDSFGDYKIEWASDLLKDHEGVATPARTPSKEVASNSYFDVAPATSPAPKKKSRYNIYASRSTWDPLHALKSLRASGEKLLIKTKFESNDPEDSDDEYAPAAYYNNDDEEDLGVLGLTFPATRVKKEYAMSKLEDSPPNDSVSVSPATPTAKGMSMNLTDKIMQEAVERRINTDIALHEAATSLVKSTEAAYNDDGYAMSPTTEEFPNFNVSATELEMSQDNSSRRRRSTAGSEAQSENKFTLVHEEQEKEDGNVSNGAPNQEPHDTSDPVHSDIIQAATDKLKQIAGIDWEAETKEDASHMEDTKNWVFAQRSEGVTSTASTAGTETAEEQPADDDKAGEQEVQSKFSGDVTATEQPAQLPKFDGDVGKNDPEVAGTSTIPESKDDISTDSTESGSTSNVARNDFRSNAPGQLSFPKDDSGEADPEAERRDSLKTPTQSSFAVSTLAHQSEDWPAQDNASESTSSLPDDVEQNLMATVETLVRKVEANEPAIGTTESSAPTMDRETSLSHSSIDGAESARSHFSNSTEEQLEVPGEGTDIDDTSSDTQWLSATEGDHGSESGTSVDWFSVQSFDNSANQSEDEDHQLHRGSDIHRDFLRRFVEHSDLRRSDLQHEISSLDSGAPYLGTDEDSTYEDPLVSDESASTTEVNEIV